MTYSDFCGNPLVDAITLLDAALIDIDEEQRTTHPTQHRRLVERNASIRAALAVLAANTHISALMVRYEAEAA